MEDECQLEQRLYELDPEGNEYPELSSEERWAEWQRRFDFDHKYGVLQPPRVQTFFNRPQRDFFDVRKYLYADIMRAKDLVIVAAAWFTDTDMVDALNKCRAARTIIILSRADINRPGTKAAIERLNVSEKVLIGGTDFKEGIMHHKFVVIDRYVVWTGSFNFTFAARKNYENLIRMEGGRVGRNFTQEAMELFREVPLWNGSTQCATAYDGTFRCGTCEKLKTSEDLGQNNGTWTQCRDCTRADQRARR